MSAEMISPEVLTENQEAEPVSDFGARLYSIAQGEIPPYALGDTPFEMMPVICSDARRIYSRHWPELQGAWSIEDVFGADRRRPWARVDRCGLVWLLRGGAIREIAPAYVMIERTETGARQRFVRPSSRPGYVAPR